MRRSAATLPGGRGPHTLPGNPGTSTIIRPGRPGTSKTPSVAGPRAVAWSHQRGATQRHTATASCSSCFSQRRWPSQTEKTSISRSNTPNSIPCCTVVLLPTCSAQHPKPLWRVEALGRRAHRRGHQPPQRRALLISAADVPRGLHRGLVAAHRSGQAGRVAHIPLRARARARGPGRASFGASWAVLKRLSSAHVRCQQTGRSALA